VNLTEFRTKLLKITFSRKQKYDFDKDCSL